MRLDPFKLERYLARYEFTAPHQLSCSDCDGLALSELLSLADGESKQLWESLTLGYTEAPGHPLLRAEIAGLYAGAGADDVLIAAPEELIFLAVNSIVRNGDHVICTFPAYQSLYQIAEGMHCEVTFWEADEKAGWRFDPARLAEMIRPSTRLIVVNFPHNPTGALPSRDDFDAIVEVARRHNLTLLCDEMYRLLEYDEASRLPAATDVYERAVSLSGMSKVFGLAGARIGWVVSRDTRLITRMLTLKDYTTICSSAPSEILSLMALRARQPIIERHVTRIRRNLAMLDAFIDTYPNLFAWHPPRAGSVCLPRIVPETLRAEALCDEAVAEAGVVLVPSSMFDFGDRHVRFGLGREAFPAALAAFTTFLEAKLTGAPARPATPVPEPAPAPAPEPEPTPEPNPTLASDPQAAAEPERPSEPASEPAPEPVAVPPVDSLSDHAVEAPPPVDMRPQADPLEEYAVEVLSPVPAEMPPVHPSPRGEPDDEPAPIDLFPPSARDAHPDGGLPGETRDQDQSEPAAGLSGPTEAADGESSAPPDSGAEPEPVVPELPEGVERGQGLPMEFFNDPDDQAAAQRPAEPADIEVVSPGDIAPEAVFAGPAGAEADEPDEVSPDTPDASLAPESPDAPPAGSWETISPPSGSWGIIPPPPDGTSGS